MLSDQKKFLVPAISCFSWTCSLKLTTEGKLTSVFTVNDEAGFYADERQCWRPSNGPLKVLVFFFKLYAYLKQIWNDKINSHNKTLQNIFEFFGWKRLCIFNLYKKLHGNQSKSTFWLNSFKYDIRKNLVDPVESIFWLKSCKHYIRCWEITEIIHKFYKLAWIVS